MPTFVSDSPLAGTTGVYEPLLQAVLNDAIEEELGSPTLLSDIMPVKYETLTTSVNIIPDVYGNRFRPHLVRVDSDSHQLPNIGWLNGQRVTTVHEYGTHIGVSFLEMSKALDSAAQGFDVYKTPFNNRKMLLAKTKLGHEKHLIDSVIPATAGPWNTTLTGVTSSPSASQFIQFDQASVDPIKTLNDLFFLYRMKKMQFKPNTLIISPDVEDKLLNHPLVQSNYLSNDASGSDRVVSRTVLEAILKSRIKGLKRLITLDATYNSNTSTVSAPEGSYMATKTCLLCAMGNSSVYTAEPTFQESILIRDYTQQYYRNMVQTGASIGFQEFMMEGKYLFMSKVNTNNVRQYDWFTTSIFNSEPVDASGAIHLISAIA